MTRRLRAIVWIPAIALVFLASTAALPAGETPARLVDPTILQPLIPAAPDGWTISRSRADRIDTPDLTFSFAEAMFTKGEMNIRLTVADTDGAEGALNILATMVMTLPEDFVGDVPPATTVRRMVLGGYQAAERYSADERDGELIILIDKRFVVKAEGKKLAGPDAMQTMIELIDLKKVAALK
jgi:hypothetical protein